MVRQYFVPKTGDGKTIETAFAPKYISDGTLSPRAWNARDFGKEDLIWAQVDTTDAEDAMLVALPDVVRLDKTGADQLHPDVATKLAGMGLPMDGFAGSTEADAADYLHWLFSLKQTRTGLDAQAAAVATVSAEVAKRSKPGPILDQFLADHAVDVQPLPVAKPVSTGPVK